jgi:hypothetical protein
MTEQKFEYDIAFSFAQKDEVLAYSIYMLLKDRLKCFIYSEEQKKLAGTDGETTFNQVFSKDSRIVVIFHSQDWGNTKWTRIEETAIKNKGFDEGYDFVILIPTDKPVNPPKWLPKTRLWIGLDRWGIESAASVIEARAQEFGGQVKELTLLEKIAQADERLKQKRKVDLLISSAEGFKIAEQEFFTLKNEFENIAKEIKATLGDWDLMLISNRQQGINLLSYNHCLTLQWYSHYAFITLSDGYYNENLQKTDFSYNYRQILAERKQFDINEFDQNGWSDHETRKNFLTTEKLVNKYLNDFFEIIHKYREKKKR